MTDATMTPEAEAEKLLECGRKRPGWRKAYLCKGDHHDPDCAASHRPAIAAALAARDARIAALEAQIAEGRAHVQTMYKLRRSPLEGRDATSSSRALAWASAQPGGIE